MNYLKNIEHKASSPDYIPHPMLKALMIAVDAARKGNKDGNYAGMSGDADLTPDKQAHLIFTVTVQKNGDIIKVLDVWDVSGATNLSPGIIDKVVHAETLLEKFDGQEVPNRTCAEIMSDTLGIKVHILEEPNEIIKAVATIQRQIAEGRIENANPRDIAQLRNFKNISQWSKLSQTARSLVGGVWAQETKNSLVITTLETSIPKWKLRESILRLLEQGFWKLKT